MCVKGELSKYQCSVYGSVDCLMKDYPVAMAETIPQDKTTKADNGCTLDRDKRDDRNDNYRHSTIPQA